MAAGPAVETFAALEVGARSRRSRRCADLPFQPRASRAPAESRHSVTLGFKTVPRQLYELAAAGPLGLSELAFELSVRGVVSICFLGQGAGRDGWPRRRLARLSPRRLLHRRERARGLAQGAIDRLVTAGRRHRPGTCTAPTPAPAPAPTKG